VMLLKVNAPTASGLSITPTSVVGGLGAAGKVMLSSPAPAGGYAVSLQRGTPGVAGVPSGVTVAAGATSATFAISTSPVAVSPKPVISATAGGVAKTASITVVPPTLSSLTLSPTSVVGGNTSTATVSLSGVTAVDVSVTVGSNYARATVSGPVVIHAGSKSATFPVHTTRVTTTVAVTITAISGGVSKTAVLSLHP